MNSPYLRKHLQNSLFFLCAPANRILYGFENFEIQKIDCPTRNGDYASRLIADTVFLLLIHFAIYCSVNKLQGKSFLYWA